MEDTAKDVQLLCPVDVLDEYRMVKAFVERKEEAEKLHVCGTCGVCDPSMRYSHPMKLADIPSEHWCRIDPRAYERLLDAEPVKQMRRGRDGTFNERTASGVTVVYKQGTVEDPSAGTWGTLELSELSFCDLTEMIEAYISVLSAPWRGGPTYRMRFCDEGARIARITLSADCTECTTYVSVTCIDEETHEEDTNVVATMVDIGVGHFLKVIESVCAVKLLPEDADAEQTSVVSFVAGLDNEVWVDVPWHEYYTKFEWAGSAYHVAPEAVEWLADDGTRRRDMPHFPHIRVCKHCHGAWKRHRGEPLAAPKDGRHDDLYWQGAARNSTACGDDLGRLRHLEEEPYRIDTHVSRLEQLALAEVRTHYVSYKVRRAHPYCTRNCAHAD